MSLPEPARITLMGLPIDDVDRAEAVARISELIDRGGAAHVVTANLDIVRQALDDPAVRRAFESADLVVADGVPLLWMARLQRTPLRGRVNGTDVTLDLLSRLAPTKGWRVSIVGGEPGVAEGAARAAAERWGCDFTLVAAPTREEMDQSGAAIADAVVAARTDLLLLAIGGGRQERWVLEHRDRLRCTVIGVGSAIDFLAGNRARAPRLLQRLGLEWAWRLAQEPRRLWKRYLMEGPAVLIRFLRERRQAAKPAADSVRACYVMLEFPVLSQTFVVDEIAALREAGAAVMTVSMEGGPGADVVLGTVRASSLRVVAEAGLMMLIRPQSVACLFRGPLTIGYRLKLLAAARQAHRFGANVVHAHFAYRSADGAEVIGRALGKGHSFTAHAHDIFVHNHELARRLDAASQVITVCDYNRDHLVQTYGDALERKLHVVPCSTSVVGPAVAARPRDNDPVILAVGRLVPKKGFDLLIRAAAGLRTRARIVLIGDGPEEHSLRQLAQETECTIEFLGAQGRDVIASRLSEATLLCLPCRVASDGDRDSMPVVIKEAMAACLPVVATNEVGVPEMVDDGCTGILVPPEDVEELRRALDCLLSDRDLAERMGEEGRRLVEEKFDLQDQAKRLLEIFG